MNLYGSVLEFSEILEAIGAASAFALAPLTLNIYRWDASGTLEKLQNNNFFECMHPCEGTHLKLCSCPSEGIIHRCPRCPFVRRDMYGSLFTTQVQPRIL